MHGQEKHANSKETVLPTAPLHSHTFFFKCLPIISKFVLLYLTKRCLMVKVRDFSVE